MRALSDAVPDHSTICRFHNLLIEQALLAKLFAELGRHDTVPADALIRGDERAVLADAAYYTHAREAASSAIVVSQRLRARCPSPAWPSTCAAG